MWQRGCILLALLLSVAVEAAELERLEAVVATVGELDFHDCALTAQHRRRYVQCASLAVPETPGEPDGAQIELFVARLPSASARASKDPVLAIAGGPGQAASDSFLWLDRAFSDVSRQRDIYLIDQRGTGLSNPQTCDLAHREDLLLANDRESFRALGRECLTQFDGDPRQYTTGAAVEDFERVRRALGVEQWNLYGVSYGTRVVQAYMRRYPLSVRTAVMDGVLPIEESLGPQIALHSQAALDALIDQCEASAECRSAYPDLESGLNSLFKTLNQSPVKIRYRDPQSGQWLEQELRRGHLVSVVRMALYDSRVLSVLPPMLASAYRRQDYAPLATMAEQLDISKYLAMGMHNSVVCSEDVPFFGAPSFDVPGEDALRDTYMGPQMVEALRGLCDVWPAAEIEASFKEPLTSSIPTLLLSGERDPITPPAYGDQVRARLENASHLVVPERGHHVGITGCVPRLVAQFVDTAKPGALDAECLDRLTTVPVFLDVNGPGP